MLEALVLKTALPGGSCLSRPGDIILVKLAGSPWGSEERKQFHIVEWEDPALEAQLKNASTQYSSIAWPYAEYGQNDQCTVFSSIGVDVSSLPNQLVPHKLEDVTKR